MKDEAQEELGELIIALAVELVYAAVPLICEVVTVVGFIGMVLVWAALAGGA